MDDKALLNERDRKRRRKRRVPLPERTACTQDDRGPDVRQQARPGRIHTLVKS